MDKGQPGAKLWQTMAGKQKRQTVAAPGRPRSTKAHSEVTVAVVRGDAVLRSSSLCRTVCRSSPSSRTGVPSSPDTGTNTWLWWLQHAPTTQGLPSFFLSKLIENGHRHLMVPLKALPFAALGGLGERGFPDRAQTTLALHPP